VVAEEVFIGYDDVFADEDITTQLLSDQGLGNDEEHLDQDKIVVEDEKKEPDKIVELKPEVKEGQSPGCSDSEMLDDKKVSSDEKKEASENKVEAEAVPQPLEGKADPQVEEKESNLPPPPPKRSSQTNQRLKRWSKMIKHSLPNKLPKAIISSSLGNGNAAVVKEAAAPAKPNPALGKDRKSLKDKVMEGELAVFLKERRAVSESRFRLLDKLSASGAARPPLPRTKSNDNIKKAHPRYIGKVRRSTSKTRNWGQEIQVGTISNLKEKFEIKSASSSPTRADLRSPSLLKEMLAASQEKLDVRGSSPASRNGKPQQRLSSEERKASIKKMQVTVTVHPAVQSLVDEEKDYQVSITSTFYEQLFCTKVLCTTFL